MQDLHKDKAECRVRNKQEWVIYLAQLEGYMEKVSPHLSFEASGVTEQRERGHVQLHSTPWERLMAMYGCSKSYFRKMAGEVGREQSLNATRTCVLLCTRKSLILNEAFHRQLQVALMQTGSAEGLPKVREVRIQWGAANLIRRVECAQGTGRDRTTSRSGAWLPR